MEMLRISHILVVLGLVSSWGCQPLSSVGKSKRQSGEERPTDELPGADKKIDTTKKPSPKPVDQDDDDKSEEQQDDEKEVEKDEEKVEVACIKAEQGVCDLEQQVFAMTNQLRKENGKPPLTLSPKLSWAARDWSASMGSSGVISHSGFPGKRQRDFQEEFGESARMAAENVAMTFSGNRAVADEFFKMWKNSSGHRANMLGRSNSIGIGIAKNARGGWYATQIFGQ